MLIAVSEVGAGPELEAALTSVRLAGHTLLLAHVIDNGARGELDLIRSRLLGRPLPGHRLRDIGAAERDAATSILGEAATVAERLGAGCETWLGEGEPGRELVRLAAGGRCELIVIGARPPAADLRPGPHSLGSTARFVVDHSPVPVLLLRRVASGRPASAPPPVVPRVK
ncbi:universal stress protein [Candidatus Dormiibacter inghamiae]|uniref:universal stress protein n=1 Tax=Candidatus Dormiibacter inghamiae TaxID=3127013 RepID=UPI0030C67D76